MLDLCLGIFKEMGYDNPGTTAKYVTGITIMAVQVVRAGRDEHPQPLLGIACRAVA